MTDASDRDERARRDREGTLLRFTGVLREDHHFIHVPAWETARAIERPETGDGSYVVDLLDGDGKVVSRVSPVIAFRAPEDPDASGLRLAEVTAYVPMHSSARVLVFRRVVPEELEIFRSDLADGPPRIGELAVDGDAPGTLRLRWNSEHERDVTFTVFYWPDEQTPFVLAAGLRENSFEVDGATLPGPTGRFAVSASDGFRSSMTVSGPLKGLSTGIRIQITSPSDVGLLPPDQPVDLRASVEDVSGTPVAVDELSWTVDGQQAAASQMAVVAAMEPGEHQIEVTGFRASEEIDRDVIRVTVADRNEEQEAFAERVAELPPLDERRAETSE